MIRIAFQFKFFCLFQTYLENKIEPMISPRACPQVKPDETLILLAVKSLPSDSKFP